MKKTLIVLMAMAVLCLMLTSLAYAGCTKEVRAQVIVHYTYKVQGANDTIRDSARVDQYVSQGHYGGGCKTSVGRQKARKRARGEARKTATREYSKTIAQWTAILCTAISDNTRQAAEWLKINYVEVKYDVLKSNGNVDKGNRLNVTDVIFKDHGRRLNEDGSALYDCDGIKRNQ